jgi:hypothetical protein
MAILKRLIAWWRRYRRRSEPAAMPASRWTPISPGSQCFVRDLEPDDLEPAAKAQARRDFWAELAARRRDDGLS